MEPDSLLILPVLALAGTIVSCINSVAGGGSVLSLPLMMWLGLPAAEANGSNRLGVWFGSLGSTLAFRRGGLWQPGLLVRTAVPGLAGSMLGALTGVFLPDAWFRSVLAVVIVWIVFETVRPRPAGPRAEGPATLRSGMWPFLAYAGIGFYGGFLQAGVGLLMMYGFSRLGNLNLLQVNALKVANNLVFASLSIAVFAAFGKIRWDWALAFAAGNFLGGFAGSVLQLRRGEGFIRGFVAVTGLAVAARLLWEAL